MMLNEIFKGMDNAAEQINENFKNGSIIESGSNTKGSFIKYGDGTMICRQTVTVTTKINVSTNFDAANRSDVLSVEFPKPFIEQPVAVVDVQVDANNTFFTSKRKTELDRVTFMIVSPAPVSFGDTTFGVTVVTIGKYK